jgi:hypothetical protein
MPNSLHDAKQQMLISPSELGNFDYVESVSELTADKVEKIKLLKPRTLGIRCKRTDHKKGLHCYAPRKSALWLPRGGCRECAAEVVNWNAMWDRRTAEDEKFAFLKTEWIRHFFFNVPITPTIEQYACDNGLIRLARVAELQLQDKRMLTFGSPLWDSYQTPMLRGNIVHWARHAVACCCRQCLSYWHNVPLAQRLTDEDIEYFKQLVVRYVQLRLPILTDESTGGGSDADSHG